MGRVQFSGWGLRMFLVISNQHFLCCNLYPLATYPWCPRTVHLWEESGFAFSRPSCQVTRHSKITPEASSSAGWTNVFTATSPCTSCVPGSWPFPDLSPEFAPVGHCLSCTGKPQTRHSTPSVASQMLNRGGHHFSHPAVYPFANTAWDVSGLLCYKSTLLTHVQVVVRPFPAKLHPFIES